MTVEITERKADEIQAWHEVQDEAKLHTLIESMRDNGWTGAPIVILGNQAITGSHRIPAAEFVGIDVPTVDITDLLTAAGTSLAELDEQYGDPDGDHYEALTRLEYHLPADVVEYYGLDAG